MTVTSNNKHCTVLWEKNPWEKGACRYAYRGVYIKDGAWKKGTKCVVKQFIDKRIFEEKEWEPENDLMKKCKEFIDQWNKANFINKTYHIFVPEIMKCTYAIKDGGMKLNEWVAAEPYISGNYEKWNSNSGWVSNIDLSVNAFSHFTFDYSKGKMVLCDMQGVRKNNKYHITDPAILSTKAGQFGMTDLGPTGLEDWMFKHVCNKYCKSTWLNVKTKPKNTIQVKQASSYLWETHKSGPGVLKIGKNPEFSIMANFL